MTIPKTLSSKQHELMLQEKRLERTLEDQRLDKLKIGLMKKLEASQLKASGIRVA
jgi:hypothetical protein